MDSLAASPWIRSPRLAARSRLALDARAPAGYFRGVSASLPLVLASASPRRRELLASAGIRFEVSPSNLPEHARPGEAPAQLARRLAGEKAGAVARGLGPRPRRWVLGADTIVVIDGEVLGKPARRGARARAAPAAESAGATAW